MNEQKILKIARVSAKKAGCPRRTPIKNFILGLLSEIYVRLLLVGVKFHIVNFYMFGAFCFNRKYFLDSNWKGCRAL
jgi:hypothetical protein